MSGKPGQDELLHPGHDELPLKVPIHSLAAFGGRLSARLGQVSAPQAAKLLRVRHIGKNSGIDRWTGAQTKLGCRHWCQK
jgi:hypothetical protein